MLIRRSLPALVLAATVAACGSSADSVAEANPAKAVVSVSTASKPSSYRVPLRHPGFDVRFVVATPTPVSLTPICDSAKICLLPINGPEFTVTGALRGKGVNSGAAHLIALNSAYASAIATFSGTMKSCGTGSAILSYTAHYGEDQPHGGGGTWQFFAGSGSGDLRKVAGGGTFFVGTTNPDLSGTARFEGRIRC